MKYILDPAQPVQESATWLACLCGPTKRLDVPDRWDLVKLSISCRGRVFPANAAAIRLSLAEKLKTQLYGRVDWDTISLVCRRTQQTEVKSTAEFLHLFSFGHVEVAATKWQFTASSSMYFITDQFSGPGNAIARLCVCVCVCVCDFVRQLSNEMSFDVDIRPGGSPCPYLGQACRSRSSVKVQRVTVGGCAAGGSLRRMRFKQSGRCDLEWGLF